MEAKLISFIVRCPITNNNMEIRPINLLPKDIEIDFSKFEYEFDFECQHCGMTHKTNILDSIIGE